jgi:prepilin-type N-terminal cleavage/methylation domain-containing protein
MKHTSYRQPRLDCTRAQTGFSMIEMMVVIAIISIIMGSVFKAIDLTQQTSRSQQVKLDLTQESREFVDQLTRDLRNSGYPYQRNMTNGVQDPNNAAYNFVNPTDPYNAPGLIFVDKSSLWFAGNVDGTAGAQAGTAAVKIIRYDYVAAGPGALGCPCLRRTEFLRNGGDPLTDASTPGAAVPQLEIQGIQNGATAADPIFTVYDDTGAAIGLPIDFDNNATTLAGINSLKMVLTVRSQQKDSSGAFPITTVVSSVALSNCSEAMGNGQTPQYCQ